MKFSKKNSARPLLSIRLMTYNHFNYIEEALKGIDIQITKFTFEVVVGDDFSTDGTLDKIKNYQFLNQNLQLKILKRKIGDNYWKSRQQKGRLYNFQNIIENCKGKYIALLDGDDYWTDPLKLQKQVDFLEANPEFILCFTNNKILGENLEIAKEAAVNHSRSVFTHNDMPLFAPTSTRVFRNAYLKGFDMKDSPGGDTFLLIWQSKFGKIKFLNEVTSVYRSHAGGIYSSKSFEEQIIHLIYTRIAVIKILEPSQLLKFYSIIFKLILELKENNAGYRKIYKCLRDFNSAHRKTKKAFTVKERILIRKLFLIFFVPKSHKWKVVRKLSNPLLAELY
ncbi:glycosyltransferase [Salinimicrobium sp. TIG7-5_MAKvit]|uniref:glycosyltransferase n=1 Tax=Salinimicrobium sp. TIG7-5_MAKvit TaxID=3121289 RepID=UPI003C6DDA37